MFTIALMTLLYINLTCPWVASENIEKRPLKHPFYSLLMILIFVHMIKCVLNLCAYTKCLFNLCTYTCVRKQNISSFCVPDKVYNYLNDPVMHQSHLSMDSKRKYRKTSSQS